MTKIIRNNKVYGGTPNNLGDIQDVDITSPTNNQALVYDSSTNKWKNDNVSAVGSLNDLTDVNISSVANKQELVYDSTDSEFKNKTTRIELTQAQYDALATPETDVDYYITDAPSMSGTSADLSYDGTTTSTYAKISDNASRITALESGKLDSSHLEFKIISGTTDSNGFLTTNLQSTAYIFLGVTTAHSRFYIPLNAFSDGTIRICALDTSLQPVTNTSIDLNCLFYKV